MVSLAALWELTRNISPVRVRIRIDIAIVACADKGSPPDAQVDATGIRVWRADANAEFRGTVSIRQEETVNCERRMCTQCL
jgi:hypothetical protein